MQEDAIIRTTRHAITKERKYTLSVSFATSVTVTDASEHVGGAKTKYAITAPSMPRITLQEMEALTYCVVPLASRSVTTVTPYTLKHITFMHVPSVERKCAWTVKPNALTAEKNRCAVHALSNVPLAQAIYALTAQSTVINAIS